MGSGREEASLIDSALDSLRWGDLGDFEASTERVASEVKLESLNEDKLVCRDA
jgi:hypothetical protein